MNINKVLRFFRNFKNAFQHKKSFWSELKLNIASISVIFMGYFSYEKMILSLFFNFW